MKHPYLHPVEPHNPTVPVCYDRLGSWLARLPEWFADPHVPVPRATLLCGLPGTGRGRVAQAIARVLRRPLHRLDAAADGHALAEIRALLAIDDPCVLWADQPGEPHTDLHHWLLDRPVPRVFVVYTTFTPQRLPAGFTRADVVESVWHLDLPDLRQRSALWGELLAAACPGYHGHDSVKLGQMSPMFTACEIQAAWDDARRVCGGTPDEGRLIDAVLRLRPVACQMDEGLACLRAWARAHATDASSETDRAEP